MNSVIEFPRNRIGGNPRNESGLPAEVVIFPGVRIDRSEFSVGEPFEMPLKRRSAPARGSDIETD